MIRSSLLIAVTEFPLILITLNQLILTTVIVYYGSDATISVNTVHMHVRSIYEWTIYAATD